MAHLLELLATGKEKRHPLKSGVNQVGRLLDNQVIVKDSLVSRHHAEIIVNEQKVIIRDLRSANHTFVNDKKIHEVNLQEGDRLTFGNTNFIYTANNISQKIPVRSVKHSPSILKQFDNLPGENDDILNKIARSKSTGKSVVKVFQDNKTDRTVEKLKLLLEVSQKLCSPQEPKKMLSTILELLFKVMDIDRAVILLVNEVTQELESEVVKVKPEIQSERSIYSRNIVEQVWRTGKTLLAADIPQNEQLKNAPSVVAASIHASICIPLKIQAERLGILYVDNLSMPLIYSDEDVDFLNALSSISASAIHMANTYSKREENLKQQIKELQIQIDPERRQQESAEALKELDIARFQRVAKKFQARKQQLD